MKKLLFSIFTLITTFFLVEVACRIFLSAPHSELSRDISGRQHYDQSAQMQKVLVLGGSTTACMGLSKDNCWVQRLDRETQWQFINAGFLGAHLEEQIAQTQGKLATAWPREDYYWGTPQPAMVGKGLKSLNPDWVILAPQVNNVAPDLFYEIATRAHPILALTRRGLVSMNLDKKFHAFYHLKRKIEFRFQQSLLSQIKQVSNRHILKKLENRYSQQLQNLVDEWGPEKVLLLQFPLLTSLSNEFDSNPQQTLGPAWRALLQQAEKIDRLVLQNIAQANDLTYLCIMCDWAESVPLAQREQYYLDLIHLNFEGMELLTHHLHEALIPRLEELLQHRVAGIR